MATHGDSMHQQKNGLHVEERYSRDSRNLLSADLPKRECTRRAVAKFSIYEGHGARKLLDCGVECEGGAGLQFERQAAGEVLKHDFGISPLDGAYPEGAEDFPVALTAGVCGWRATRSYEPDRNPAMRNLP